MTANTPTYYKVLNEDGSCHHGGVGAWQVGQRRAVEGPLLECENAIHACTIEQLVYWLGPAIHTIELEDMYFGSSKFYARAGILGSRIETWNPTTGRLFAAKCAERMYLYGADKRTLYVGSKKTTSYYRTWTDIWTAAWDVRSAAWHAGGDDGQQIELAWQTMLLHQYLTGEAG